MQNNIYNKDEEQYKNVIDSLKQLPHVDAPPDFDMNLKRRLNNIKYEREKKPFWAFLFERPLIPAASAAALVLIVLAVSLVQKDIEAPFPKPDSLTAQIEKSKPDNAVTQKETAAEPKKSENLAAETPAPRQNPKPLRKETITSESEPEPVASNDILRQQLKELDLSGFGSDLDKNLRAKPNPGGLNEYGNPGSNVSFDEFNLAPSPGRSLNMIRSKTDSIRRFWLKRVK